MIKSKEFISNNDGWQLTAKQVIDPDHLDPALKPVVLIPGYAMNAFAFSYHPNKMPMEDYFASHGFEVWSVNLRGQGDSKCLNGNPLYTFKDMAVTDLGVVMDHVFANTKTTATKADLIGCSLGGTIAFAYIAVTDDERVDGIVSAGAPLRWDTVPPILKFIYRSPKLIGMIPLKGTRKMAELALPLAMKFPFLISIYLHPEIVEMGKIREFLKAIDDPVRSLNEEIGWWLKRGDVIIDGVNVTERVGAKKNPLLCVVARGDGIVPEEAAKSPCKYFGSENKEYLYVGDDDQPYGHADLFISNHSQEVVFAPIADWLKRNNANA